MAYCSREEVKRSLEWAASETQHDEIVDEIVEDVTARIDSLLPHDSLLQTQYTEYHDGGGMSIILVRRPLISITSVHDDTNHEFGSDVLVAATEYFAERSELGIIRKKSGRFQSGCATLKVIYDAGYETLPTFVRRLAVEVCVSTLKRRHDPDLKTWGHREGTITRRDLDEEERKLKRVLAPLL